MPGRRVTARFSSTPLSPVITDWETNRSFASVRRMSAGTRSPAASRTRSPTTSSVEQSSVHRPARSTRTRVAIMPVRWSATRLARSSCTKRTAPLMSSIPSTMNTVVRFRLKLEASSTSVTKEMAASTSNIMEKGVTKARRSR